MSQKCSIVFQNCPAIFSLHDSLESAVSMHFPRLCPQTPARGVGGLQYPPQTPQLYRESKEFLN